MRVLYGGRTSLLVGLASAVLCVALALVLALVAGTLGGVPDALISRLLDLIWSFPVYLLAVALAATLEVGGLEIGPLHVSSTSIWIPIVIIAVVFVPYVARPIRGQVLSLRQMPFVEAAEIIGCRPARVIFRHLLPNLTSPLLTLMMLEFARVVLAEASLSFLGLGVQPPASSWGLDVATGKAYIFNAWWLVTFPGLAIALTGLAINLLASWARMTGGRLR